MFTDINHPTYYTIEDAENLAHELHKAGLHNVGQLIKGLYAKIESLESELEKTEEEYESARSEGYESGLQAGSDTAYESYCEHQDNKATEFSRWFLKEFEPESKKCMKEKEICGTKFIIMTKDNYDDLKYTFHKMCD